jgi:hypothetical protein
VWNTNFQDWKHRDVCCLHENTMHWKNATTRSEQEQIFKETGVHWSELWCLPYWDPT